MQNVQSLKEAGFQTHEIDEYHASQRISLSQAGFSDEEIGDHLGKPVPDIAPVKTLFNSIFSSVIKNKDEQAPANVPDSDVPELPEDAGFTNEEKVSQINELSKGKQLPDNNQEVAKQAPAEELSFSELIEKGLTTGYQSSVTGLIQREKLPDKFTPEDADMAERIASQVGTLAGDFPFMVAGAFAGSTAAIGGGQAGPLALLPEEIVTVPTFAMGGAFALPAGMRESLMQGYQNGSYESFGDFWSRSAAVFLETAKGFITGAATGKAGELAAPGMAKQFAAEVATMVSVGKALENEVPSPQDFIDAAIIVGGLKTAVKTAQGTMKLTEAGVEVAKKLQEEYVKTGKTPDKIVEEIINDPIKREQILSDRKPVEEPPADTTKLPDFETVEQKADLLGQDTSKQQALANRQTEIDQKLGKGQEAIPAESKGDLFDANRGKQVDIEDVATKKEIETSTDPRLKRQEHIAALEQMGKELQPDSGGKLIGGRLTEEVNVDPRFQKPVGTEEPVTRTPSENPPWFQEMMKDPDLKMSVVDVQKAINKAVKGEKLGVRQERVVIRLLDEITGERTDPRNIESVRQKIEDARTLRQEAGSDIKELVSKESELGLKPGEVYVEEAYNPGWDGVTRSLYELTKEAEALNPEATRAILEKGVTNHEAAKLLTDLSRREREKGQPGDIEKDSEGKGSTARIAESQRGSLAPEVKPLSEVEVRVLDQVSKEGGGRETTTIDELYRQFVDRKHPLNVLTKLLAEGKELPISINPYKQARLSVSANSKSNLFLELEVRDFNTGKVVGRGLKLILDPVKEKMESFRAYMVSRRAVELSKRDIETGIDITDAKAVASKGDKQFNKIFNELVEYQTNVLKYLRDSGVISKEMFIAMSEANKDYVPFFRLFDESKGGIGTGVRNPIKKIKGSERKIIDPLESIIKNTYLYVEIAERNAVGRSLVELAEQSAKGEEFVRKVKTPIKPIRVEDKEVKKVLAEYEKEFGVEVTPEELTIFRPNILPVGADQISIFRNGKREVYEVDKDVADIIKGMDKESSNLFVRIIAVPARTLRAGAILNPEFFARNLMRDNITAAVYSTSGFRPFVDFVSGMTSLVKKDAKFRDWVFGGGPHATLVSLDRVYLRTNLKRLTEQTSLYDAAVNVSKAPLELLRIMSELAENATRIGEFKRATRGKEGKESIQEAAFKSREITLDFARMGASMRGMNMISAFWNARIQGYDRMVRAFKDNPVAATSKAVATITVPSILLWIRNHDDKRYKELPDWQKNLFWIVLTDDHIFRIPKPFELGIIFGTFPERILDKWADSNKNLGEELMTAIKNDSLSSFIPNFLTPLIEQKANVSLFRDSPLVPTRLENLLPEDRYTEYSTELSKALGKFIANIPGQQFNSSASPIVIENYIRQWSGGLGVYALKLTDKALREAGVIPDPPKPKDTLADVPFIKGFVVRYPSSGAQSIRKFYENFSKSEQVLNSVKARVKSGDIEGVEELIQSNPTELSVRLGAIRKVLSMQSKTIRNINKNPDMSPEEKRTHIDNLYYEMINVAQQGNEIMNIIKESVR